MYIVDRRLNPGGKSLGEPAALPAPRAGLRAAPCASRPRGTRHHAIIERAATSRFLSTGSASRTCRAGPAGRRDRCCPGNRDFVEGDTVDRPPGGGGSCSRRRGRRRAAATTISASRCSQDEFLDLFLDDLELPDLAKPQAGGRRKHRVAAGGGYPSGSRRTSPSLRTMRRQPGRVASRCVARRARRRANCEEEIDGSPRRAAT